MKSGTCLSLILIVALTTGAGCARLVDTAGKLSGSVAGKAVAQAAPPPKAAVKVDPQGGAFCPTMKALGWPPEITDDKLNPPFERATVATLEHGEAHCGWQAP